MAIDLRGQKELLFPRVEEAAGVEDLKNIIRELIDVIAVLHQNMKSDSEVIYETVGGGYTYFGTKHGDTWDNGTWRLGVDGDNFLFERKESGTWVEKSATF